MKRSLSLCGLIWVCAAVSLWGQQDNSNLGGLYIPSETSMTIFGNLNFSEGGAFNRPGIITTYKHPIKKGIIHFAESSHWLGTSDTKFVDGYAGSFHKESFVFPIGGDENYKPVAVSNSYGSFAAYYPKSSSDLGSQLTPDLEKINKREYWHISTAHESKITLSWNSDTRIDDLIRERDLETLTIVAFKDGQWYPIESSIDKYMLDKSKDQVTYSDTKSNAKTGSITTGIELVAGEFEFFTLGTLAVEEIEAIQFTMSPNPQMLDDIVDIYYELPNSEGGQLFILSSDNQLTHSQKIVDQAGIVSLNSFKDSGSYFVGIQDSRGEICFKTVIIVD